MFNDEHHTSVHRIHTQLTKPTHHFIKDVEHSYSKNNNRANVMNQSKQAKINFLTYLVLIFIFCGLLNKALSANEDINQEITKANHLLVQEVGTGTLLMRSDKQSYYEPANLLSTDAKISISGPIAQTELTQTFTNTGQHFSESIYIFPLPENAAVEYMELYIGDRRIIGKILEKLEAKKVYIQAKQDGKRAALVEQSRPNLFTTSVANIPAGAEVSVTLRFTQNIQVHLLKSEYQGVPEQHFEYRLPLTLTPRYQSKKSPNTSKQPLPFENQEELLLVNHNNIYPPQLDYKSNTDARNKIRIDVEMHGLNNTHQVKSLYQAVNQKTIDNQRRIEFMNDTVVMDQDLVLQWRLNTQESQQASFFTETIDGEEYGLLMLTPPDQSNNKVNLAREIIFIIDSSGSMGGESMRQAKEGLSFALNQLANTDRFNIIDFDSQYRLLFDTPQQVNDSSIRKAQNFVNALIADNGTNMLDALTAALRMPTNDEYLKQIIFITDGSVDNETKLFELIYKELKQARLFTVGIGSAPNSYFMRKAAEFGRGTFTYIGAVNEVRPQMSLLFNKISSPILQDIELEFPHGIDIEKWPEFIPDLYEGEPLVIPIKFNRRPEWISVKARTNTSWEQTFTINQTEQNLGVASLWARAKIASLMDKMIRGSSEANIKPQIIDVALQHNLLSKYTSFIAVDDSIVRNQSEDIKTKQTANLLPKGHNYPSTATGIALWNLFALLTLLLSFIYYRSCFTIKVEFK